MSAVVHVKAFALFCRGKPFGIIAKAAGVTRRTIHRWRKIEDWDRERLETQHIARKVAAKAIRSEWQQVSTEIIKGMDDVSKAIFQQIRAVAALGQHRIERELAEIKVDPDKGGRKLNPFDYKLMADALMILESRRLDAQRAILGEDVANEGDIICNVSIVGIDTDDELEESPAMDPCLLQAGPAQAGGNGGGNGGAPPRFMPQGTAVQGGGNSGGGNKGMTVAEIARRQSPDEVE